MHARSYLGFGLMAGRAAVLAWEETRAANPCIPADHSGTYEYAGAVHELTSHPDGASFGTCSKLITMVLKLETDCGAPRVRARLISFRLVAFWVACHAFRKQAHTGGPLRTSFSTRSELLNMVLSGDAD